MIISCSPRITTIGRRGTRRWTTTNTYAITFNGHIYNSIGETAAKSKYELFLKEEFGDFLSFGEFVKYAKCKLLHKFKVQDLFTKNIEGFNRMKMLRGIEFAQLGMKVEGNGKPGVIVGHNSSLNLDVCLDGQYWASNCHPWWRMKYFDNKGDLIKEYGD